MSELEAIAASLLGRSCSHASDVKCSRCCDCADCAAVRLDDAEAALEGEA